MILRASGGSESLGGDSGSKSHLCVSGSSNFSLTYVFSGLFRPSTRGPTTVVPHIQVAPMNPELGLDLTISQFRKEPGSLCLSVLQPCPGSQLSLSSCPSAPVHQGSVCPPVPIPFPSPALVIFTFQGDQVVMNFLQWLLPTLRAQFKISHVPECSGQLSSLCLLVEISLGRHSPCPIGLFNGSELGIFHFLFIYLFETDFHSSSAWPRTLNNPPVSASPVCLFGLRTSSAALSGQWLGSEAAFHRNIPYCSVILGLPWLVTQQGH